MFSAAAFSTLQSLLLLLVPVELVATGIRLPHSSFIPRGRPIVNFLNANRSSILDERFPGPDEVLCISINLLKLTL